MRQEILAALLIYPCALDIIPPKTKVVRTMLESLFSKTQYNNKLFNLSNTSYYGPLDKPEFHWYTPDYCNGMHQSLDLKNNHPKFNIISVAQQACLLIAHQINNFITTKFWETCSISIVGCGLIFL